jgi:two-component system chemotaxis response regulator CheY
MRVLIIDDSIVMRKIVESAIRQCTAGISDVLHAANGKDALSTLHTSATQRLSIELIFCDVHMPIMDGLKFLAEKPAYPSFLRTPVVMITADPGDPYLRRAIAAGASGYIAKPFTLDQVRTTIESVLRGPGRRVAPPPTPGAAPLAPKTNGGVR